LYQNHSSYHPLFSRFKGLERSLSYVELGDFPTPVTRCSKLSSSFKGAQVYLKNDGLTGKVVHGKRTCAGNKLRKLEYLLADAIAHECTSVLTFGCAGSNHALQTAWYAKSLGLRSISMLLPQPNSKVVQRNLLLQAFAQADIYYAKDRSILSFLAPAVCYIYKQRFGSVPYPIPVGGSCPLGAVGYVQAAFELKDQIEQGFCPMPDRVYVALGSGGTAAGLLLGLQAAGISTKLYCVLDEPETKPGSMKEKVTMLFAQTNELLHKYDSSFGIYQLQDEAFEICDSTSGEQYGLLTQEAKEAIAYMKEQEQILLEGTYTGKCFALLLRHLRAGDCAGKTVLYWDTFCGESFERECRSVDYTCLPKAVQCYFETPVQPLDA
jgi:D-cysteine desulfhydrase